MACMTTLAPAPSDPTRVESPANALAFWRLQKVRRFIDANIDAPLCLADLAAVAGLSRMYFAAQFRAATGQRPHDYVLARRVARAQTLLRSSDETLVNIALDVGFQSQAHFCNVFKKLTGRTPAAWRRDAIRLGQARLDHRHPGQRPQPTPTVAFLRHASAEPRVASQGG